MFKTLIIYLAVFTTFSFASSGALQSHSISNDASGSGNYFVRDLLSLPEDEIDIGFWALVIAKECDSTVDIDKYLHMLDTMAAKIKYMVGPREGDMVRFMMTKMYQFDPGDWNGGQVFSYDLDDPMGEQPGARLLTSYLDTRRGNCVSMPTLFLALMERVAPDILINGVAAPLHLFCRLHDRQDGSVWNVETTNGGSPNREEWYLQEFEISQTALDSGLYMRDLTKKEFVAELVGILVSKYRQSGDYEQALKYDDLMLQLNPRSLTGLVSKGALLGWLGHTMQERIRLEGRKPTDDEHEKLRLYMVESERYIAQARSLGWEPETPESKAAYLERIREAKSDNSE